MRILVFGSKGYLGQQFLRVFPDAIPSTADIADASAVADTLDREKPDVVINAAGKTGRPNVDWCEDHKEETIASNVTGPLVLLDECAKRNVYWVHLGSGCIYEGDNGGRGFTEGDPPNFFGSFYAKSKAWIDQILKEFPARPDGIGGVLVLRLRMPFDGSDSERSLINKIKKYPRVLDAKNSITYMPDFMEAAKKLIEKGKTGLYNIVNPGSISPYEIMMMYKDSVDPNHEMERLALDQLPEVTKAGRSNCILSNKKLSDEGITMRPVDAAVREALQTLKKA